MIISFLRFLFVIRLGKDAGGTTTFKVVPFAGISGISLPAYLRLTYSIVDRQYVDGKVKPVAYDYRAIASNIKPAGDYLELTATMATRFEDVIQCDAAHRFFTDAERAKLKGIAEHATNYSHPATHPATMIVEDATHRFTTDTEKNKLAGMEAGANRYVHPGNHPATMITEDATHRFTTDTEKNSWNSKAAGNHNHAGVYQPVGSYAPASHTHPATQVNEDSTHRFMTDTERTKLNGIAAGANNYVHPATHPASIITEDATHRFMTDGERSKLGGIASGANNYIHPATHPASIIEESPSRKFMSDVEKTLLSSLGSNAALKDFSNVTTQSLGQYGYCKFPNGLLIQWGYALSNQTVFWKQTVYLPLSFYNESSYIVTLTAYSTFQQYYVGRTIAYLNSSSFVVSSNQRNQESFYWFAIGRWK